MYSALIGLFANHHLKWWLLTLKTPLAVIRADTEMIELSLGVNEWTQ